MPRTSSSRRMRCSSPSILISDPEYLPNRMRSPAFTSRGMTLPSSLIFPLPTATTLPSWGFSFAVSGMMMPPALFCSCSSSRLTISRSARGRIRVAMTGTSLPGSSLRLPGHQDNGLWIVGASRDGSSRRSRAAQIRSFGPAVKGRRSAFSAGLPAGSTDAGYEAVLDPAREESAGFGGCLGRIPVGQRLADLAEGPPGTQPLQGGPLEGVHGAVVYGPILPPDPEGRPGGGDVTPVAPEDMEGPVALDDLQGGDGTEGRGRPFGLGERSEVAHPDRARVGGVEHVEAGPLEPGQVGQPGRGVRGGSGAEKLREAPAHVPHRGMLRGMSGQVGTGHLAESLGTQRGRRLLEILRQDVAQACEIHLGIDREAVRGSQTGSRRDGGGQAGLRAAVQRRPE